MTDFTPFHQVIRERIISPGAKYYADPWWDAEIKQFTIDMNASIRFIDEEITDEELYWLGEVFEDIMEKTQSEAFLNCLRRRVLRVENPEWKESIQKDILPLSEYLDP